MELKKQAILGVTWNGLGKIVIQTVQLGIMIILARILMPADFGVIATTMIFTRLITLLNEMGIAAAVIQKEKIETVELATLFTASLVFGIFLSITLIACSLPLARFYNKEILAPILKLSSVTLIIGSLSVIQKALLNRNLNFKKIAQVEIFGIVGYGVVSIILAIKGYGVWSIVWGNIANHVLSTIIFWFVSEWKPILQFNFKCFLKLCKFGLNVFGTNLVNYTGMNLASLIIGKFLGMTSLGLYDLANNLTSQTVGRLTFIIGRVMFPTLSQMQNDNKRFANAYMKVLQVLIMIISPLLIGVAALARPFVFLVFGEKWNGSILPLQVLALVAILGTISSTVGFVLISKGRSDIELKFNIIYIFIYMLMLLFSIRFGLNGVVVSIVLITLISGPIIQKISFSLIDIKLMHVYLNIAPILISSTMMGIIVYAFSKVVSIYLATSWILVCSILIGIVVYLALLRILNRDGLKEIKTSLVTTFFA